MIKFESISKKFNENSILENVNMKIADGKTIGLCGESGVGKSTLARIAVGLIPPDLGRITIDDEILTSSSIPYSRKSSRPIQLVSQHPYEILDPTQKVGKGLEEVIRFSGMKGVRAIKEHAKELLREVELEPSVLGHLPHQISGGEAERIALAKALCFSPRLIILDEGTAMLDAITEANILDLVKRKQQERGFSILMISHDEKLLPVYCDDIYKINDKTTTLIDKKL